MKSQIIRYIGRKITINITSEVFLMRFAENYKNKGRWWVIEEHELNFNEDE